MAASSVKLPPGFQLETPGKQVEPGTPRIPGKIALPPGFQLESPEKDVQGFDSSPLKPRVDSPVYQKAKEFQATAGKKLGEASARLMSSTKIPSMIQAPLVVGTKAAQKVVEHPREALIAGGAVAAPLTGGASGLLATSLLAGGGAAAGELAAQAGEKALGAPGAPKTIEESLLKAGKVGAVTTAATLIPGAALKVVGKIAKPFITAFKSAKTTANVKLAGQAIGDVEKTVGLDKIPLESFQNPAAADAYLNTVSKVKGLQGLSTDDLYKIHKNAQTIGNAYPRIGEGPAGVRFFSKVGDVRKELYKRLPELGEKANSFAAELIKSAADKVRIADKIKATRVVRKILWKTLGAAGAGAGAAGVLRVGKAVLE